MNETPMILTNMVKTLLSDYFTFFLVEYGKYNKL